MRSAILAAIFPTVALAQSSPVQAVSNPAVQYLTETNSLGVVTGQPTPVLSQSPAASIPAGLSGVPVVPSASRVAVVPSASGASTIVTISKPPGYGSSSAIKSSPTGTTLSSTVASTSTASSDSSTGSTSGSSTTSTNGAVMATAAPVGLSLGLAGAIFAAFL